jgi:DNA-binding XRE family transcriptional regulator
MITTSQIRGARAMLGMTQAELAKRAGISTTGLNNVETGNADPKVSTMRAIRAALESAGVVFTNNGQPGVSVQATAEGIIRAGEIARAGGPALPEPTGLAKAILDAGKRRRGEIE